MYIYVYICIYMYIYIYNNLRVTRNYRLSVPSELNVVSHEL